MIFISIILGLSLLSIFVMSLFELSTLEQLSDKLF